MRRLLIYDVVLTLAALAASYYLGWVRPNLLADPVPIHWNLEGRPDGFVPRDRVGTYLLLVPAVMAGFVLLSLALPWLSPRQFGIERFRRTYDYVVAVAVTLFAYLHAVALMASARVPLNMTTVLLGGMFLFLALIGNVLGKVQRNFYVGIRTPWTLADESVWIRTHRLGAWVLTTGSLACFIALLAGVPPPYLFFALLAVVLVPVVYSLVLYKRLERQGKLSAQAVQTPEGQP
jgi:uncharacterized membrane protein